MAARAFTSDELNRILVHLRTSGAHRDFLLVRLGTALGFRISELLSIRCAQVWTDVAATNELIVVRRLMKGGRGTRRATVRSRSIVLAPSVRADVTDYFLNHRGLCDGDEYLFRSREGGNRPISAPQAHRIIVAAAKAVNIDVQRISTHSLRKTFCASAYTASNRDLIRVQRLVGHSSPVTTARYLESTQADLDELAVLVAG